MCSKSLFDSICIIIHVNIVSLNKNFDTLKLFLSRFSKVDVLCLSETRLNDCNLVYCQLPGYKLYIIIIQLLKLVGQLCLCLIARVANNYKSELKAKTVKTFG